MKSLFRVLVLVLLTFPSTAGAAKYAPFEISGWIPYWRSASGTAQALEEIDSFKELNPFSYSVNADGTLVDLGSFKRSPWPEFFAEVRKREIRLIPTIMWSHGPAIHEVLSDPALRARHIASIMEAVFGNGFDGIDIDYEAKLADTNPYFSLFLKELYLALGPTKWVMCTIEPRTPLASRNVSASSTPRYANDYSELNKYCDRVRIMAYDQTSVDRDLADAAQGPYVPVSDVRWAEKVMREAMQTISKSKLMLGVATYGYEYELLPLSSGYKYDRVTAFNPRYAVGIIEELGVTPVRNVAGELSFVYAPRGSRLTPAGPVKNILWWSDAGAIEDKLLLAKSLGIRGVSIFKIDGGADPALWDVLPRYR